MSVEALAIVLHHSQARGTAKLVLIGVANHEGDGGAWPSVGTLATYANVSERSVQRALAELVDAGELAVEVQGGGLARTPDHERPNRYQVLVACPPWCDRTAQHRDTRRRPGEPGGTDHDDQGQPEDTPKAVDNRVTPVSPGGVDNRVTPASPGDASVTGGGDASVTRTIPRTIHPHVTSTGTVTRASTDPVDNEPPGPLLSGPRPSPRPSSVPPPPRYRQPDDTPCSVCGQGESGCQRRQRRVALADQHAYDPVRSSA